MARQYYPIGDRVIVRRDDLGKVSSGGILIPDSAQEYGRLATVVAVGPGRVTGLGVLIPTTVKPGDAVLTHKAKAGRVVENEGKDGEVAVLHSESEIACIVREGPEKYEMLGDRLLVQRDDDATEVNGILVPYVARRDERSATVVAVGPGRCDERGELHPVGPKVGDRILTDRHAGVQLRDESVDSGLLMLSESQVLCVVEQ